MLLLARRNLMTERTRLAISVGGVALSVFLISLLLSLYRGWDEKVGGFVQDSDVDLWVASEGAVDFMTAASLLPLEGPEADALAEYLDSNEDIERWSPLIVRQMEGFRADHSGAPTGKRINLQLVGFDTDARLGGPIRVTEGTETPGEREVIIDEAISDEFGIDVGGGLQAGGLQWKVAGESSGGDFVFTQTAFVTHGEAQSALGMEGQTTFYALKLGPGADGEKVAAEIESLAPGVIAYTRAEFTKNTRDRVMGNVLPIILIILALAFIVGLAVAGLTIYTATVEKSREYGVLKAVGFNNAYLYRLVVEQSLVTSLLGFVFGFGLTLLVSPFARDLASQMVLFVRWQDALAVLAATALMGLIAAYVPVRRLAGIDPTAVFRA